MTIDFMRERFEAWMSSLKTEDIYDFDSEGRGYKKDATRIMRLAWQAATLAERERCAAVCDLQWTLTSGHVAKQCAKAIRKGE